MKVVWLLFQHSVRSDLKSHRKTLEIIFPFGQDGGQLGDNQHFLRYLNLSCFFNCLNSLKICLKLVEHKWPILKVTWVSCNREAISFCGELCHFKTWKRSCARSGWCATAIAVLIGTYGMSSSFFKRQWWTSLLVLSLWCCDFSWHEKLWIYTIKNDKKTNKTKPKQNSRAQENFLSSQRSWYSVYFYYHNETQWFTFSNIVTCAVSTPNRSTEADIPFCLLSFHI